MPLEPGTPAPPFSLKDQDRNDVTLADFTGTRNVALVFYPFTFTGVCEGELCALRDDLARYEAANVQVIAISCDSPFVHKRWADDMGYGFPLLADHWPHGAVAKSYDTFNDALGCANRSTFLIDTEGTIVDVISSDSLGEAREADAYAQALAKLAG